MEPELLEDFCKWLTREMYYFGELTEDWYKEGDMEDEGKTFDELIKEFKNI